jgi:hypothetical protein
MVATKGKSWRTRKKLILHAHTINVHIISTTAHQYNIMTDHHLIIIIAMIMTVDDDEREGATEILN